MKLWKRNAIVVAIVLFVGAAVYLNWSYGQEADADAAASGKLLGEAALVSGNSEENDAQAPGEPNRGKWDGNRGHGGYGGDYRLFCLRPAEPPAGQRQRSGDLTAGGG